jgi:hypothetical protein
MLVSRLILVHRKNSLVILANPGDATAAAMAPYGLGYALQLP